MSERTNTRNISQTFPLPKSSPNITTMPNIREKLKSGKQKLTTGLATGKEKMRAGGEKLKLKVCFFFFRTLLLIVCWWDPFDADIKGTSGGVKAEGRGTPRSQEGCLAFASCVPLLPGLVRNASSCMIFASPYPSFLVLVLS